MRVYTLRSYAAAAMITHALTATEMAALFDSRALLSVPPFMAHGGGAWAVCETAHNWKWGTLPGWNPAEFAAVSPACVRALAGLAEPTAAELAANFTRALARWLAAGLPITSEAEHAGRLAACRECPLWDAAALAGTGRCKHPKCGCSKLKHWLKTERCPAGKWAS